MEEDRPHLSFHRQPLVCIHFDDFVLHRNPDSKIVEHPRQCRAHLSEAPRGCLIQRRHPRDEIQMAFAPVEEGKNVLYGFLNDNTGLSTCHTCFGPLWLNLLAFEKCLIAKKRPEISYDLGL